MPYASAISELGALTPDQFSDHRLSPEKRLMLAVLLDAVECFQKHAPSRHAFSRPAKPHPLFTDAATWIFEDDDDSLFSFINICEAVEMNPQYLRKILSHGQAGAMLHDVISIEIMNVSSPDGQAAELMPEKKNRRLKVA